VHATVTDLVSTAASAESVRAALEDVSALLLQGEAVTGIEWWTQQDGGRSYHLERSDGITSGARVTIDLGPVGQLVLFGESPFKLASTLDTLRPVLRRRWSEEQLAKHASRLARRAEALDDFAALVAHDVKSALVTALREDDPRAGLTRALELVDSILEAVRVDQAATGVARLADVVQRAIADVGENRVEIVAGVTGEFPMPPDALRLVLRNLIANGVAAGAERIHISALAEGHQCVLVVDDDGVGLASGDGYTTGTQLGLRLSCRLVERCGGKLELKPRAARGTRAVIVVARPGT
jgi:signal transduction histidine kinase